MPDEVMVTETAMVEKYSQEQLEQSRALLGRDPEGHELRAHHDAPAHGITYGEDEPGPEPATGPAAGESEGEDA